jgi:hypothetical protein
MEATMADYVRTQGEGVPPSMRTRYIDRGDGTHALVVDLRASSAAVGGDAVLNVGQGLPATLRTRYAEQANGTHALVLARGI